MNHYKHHLGDYAKDTRHLSMLEHGAYRLLMDHYYSTEKSIPDSLCERIANASTKAERSAVRSVLAQFFTLVDGRWIQHRCEEVLQEYFSKATKASESAKARWDANPAMRTHSERNAKAMLAISHKPVTSNQEAFTSPNGEVVNGHAVDLLNGSGKKANGVPYQRIVSMYHEALPMLPRCEKLTPGRMGCISARWREDLPNLEAWENFFADVALSPFLTGRIVPKDPNQKPFRASLAWICKPENFAKIMEGQYHR